MSVIIEDEFLGRDYPLTHPRLCYDVPSATLSASDSADGADPAWLGDGETWSVWKPDSLPVSINRTYSEPTEIDYIGIAAHTLGRNGCEVRVRFDFGEGFVESEGIPDFTPTDDSAILILFEPKTVVGVRFRILSGDIPEVAVFTAGRALEMPRKSIYTELPISESEQIRYQHNQSVRGDVLGRRVEGSDLEFSVSIQNLPETFRTSDAAVNWRGFKQHIEGTGPFFIATRPASYPDDVAYARLARQPRFDRAIPNRRISGEVQLSCVGYRSP